VTPAAPRRDHRRRAGSHAEKEPRPAAPRGALRGWQRWLPAAVVAATVIAFWPAIHNGFTNWDDPQYVSDNYGIRDLSADNLTKMFTKPLAGNYQPLTILSYALDYRFWKRDPKGYHITNVVLHVLCTLAVFWLVLLLARSAAAATVASLFFGIHPLHVESVAWISGRKDVLYTLFYLLACIFYARWIAGGRKRPVAYAGALLCFALSLLSKAMAVTLPAALALIDWHHSKSVRWRRWAVELLPFLALSAVFGVTAIVMQREEKAIQEFALFPVHERILFAFYAVQDYLVRAIVPVKLSAIYPYPDRIGGALPAAYYLAPVLVAAVAALVIWSLRRTREVAFGMLFFLANVALVLQLIPVGNAIVADRYTYLSFVGFGFILGTGFHRSARSPSVMRALGIVGVVAAVSLTVATRARCEVWKDSIHLWNDTLSKYPNVSLAYNNRALSYMTRGDYDLALADLGKALSIYPDYYHALLNRGNIAYLRRQYDSALADLERAVKLRPSGAGAWNGLGVIHFAQGAHEKALEEFSRAIELYPDYAEAYLNRANLLSLMRRFDRAIPDYDAYLAREPANGQAYYWRGLARSQRDDLVGAVRDYDAAIALSPRLGEAYLARARAYEQTNRFADALRDVEQAQALGAQAEPSFLERLRSHVR
jgi:protein O-mannosyl-transferase